ncbi:carbohydrate kinase family protein [Baekduia sp. Peel2402]|uniref:carbohydrate kinase family protein n=1 Tax=Baekduia sp. Peel2402 TaxID=3458296 RepID=UPI00403EEFAB
MIAATSDLHAALRASTPKVAAIGTYIVDVLGRPVSELPVGQNTRLLDEIRLTAAGTAGGTAVDLARLGAQVTAVASIGTDLAGDFLLLALQQDGIDTTNIVRRDAVQTSATILPIHPDGSRPAWHVPGANMLFTAADVPDTVLTGADAVHLGGLTALPGIDGAPAGELLAKARAAGAITTADCLGVRGDDPAALLASVLPHVDYFMPNDGEALAITGATDPIVAARDLRDLGAATVIVKCGPEGAVIADADGVRAIPGFAVEQVVDTTGCGDAFCAGVIVARCAGWPVDDAARLGCATGALNVRALGSDAGARDVDEALAFLDAAATAMETTA